MSFCLPDLPFSPVFTSHYVSSQFSPKNQSPFLSITVFLHHIFTIMFLCWWATKILLLCFSYYGCLHWELLDVFSHQKMNLFWHVYVRMDRDSWSPSLKAFPPIFVTGDHNWSILWPTGPINVSPHQNPQRPFSHPKHYKSVTSWKVPLFPSTWWRQKRKQNYIQLFPSSPEILTMLLTPPTCCFDPTVHHSPLS